MKDNMGDDSTFFSFCEHSLYYCNCAKLTGREGADCLWDLGQRFDRWQEKDGFGLGGARIGSRRDEDEKLCNGSPFSPSVAVNRA